MSDGASIRVRVNGEWREFDAGLSVEDVLSELGIEQKKGLAVARNDHVVSRSGWALEVVEDEDRLEIIRATRGG